jgi:hypothetical protein
MYDELILEMEASNGGYGSWKLFNLRKDESEVYEDLGNKKQPPKNLQIVHHLVKDNPFKVVIISNCLGYW